jgi:hypothetical protein
LSALKSYLAKFLSVTYDRNSAEFPQSRLKTIELRQASAFSSSMMPAGYGLDAPRPFPVSTIFRNFGYNVLSGLFVPKIEARE